MIDPQKIITMTKLAIYDKEGAEQDLNADRFFRHDFIYRRNMWLRLYVVVGSLIVIGFRILHMVAVDQVDLFSLNFQEELINAALFILILQVAYSIIGTVQYTVEYEKSQKRMRAYFALMDKLDPPEAEAEPEPVRRTAPRLRPHQNPEARVRKEPEHTYGTASMDTRKHHKLL